MKHRTIEYQILSLISIMRVRNLILLVLAQYLAAIFIFSVNKDLIEVLSDVHLHLIVLSSIFAVASGYIINDFYDKKIDAINRPVKTYVDTWVDEQTKLHIYFSLNFISVFIGFFISLRAGFFFITYTFLIWMYSHKLKEHPWLQIISISILGILPFFAIFIYYKNISFFILMHGFYLFLLISLKELIKDFRRIKGMFLSGRSSLVLKYGVLKVKFFVCLVLILLVFLPQLFIAPTPNISPFFDLPYQVSSL